MMTNTKADPLREALEKLRQWPQEGIAALESHQRQIDRDGCEVGVSRQAVDEVVTLVKAIRAALAIPPAAPLREADPEPVAWTVLSTDADRIRIWWRDKELAEKWAAEHSLPLIPLYAKPFATADFLALAAVPQERVDRAMVPEIQFDPTNHHNAMKCPYCNPAGLVDRAAVIEECARVADRISEPNDTYPAPANAIRGTLGKKIATAIRALANAKGDA
jgi:hypothetical protein